MDVAVIGDRYFVTVFRLAGIDTVEAENEDLAVNETKRLVDEGKYQVIFISEKVAAGLESLRESLLKERKLYPVFVVVPDFTGSLGQRKKELSEFVNKSMGIKLKIGD